MRFLRQLGESLGWQDDRIAMALFAHIATPQVRLTKDPNTYFFFLDHLSEESPFRLEDDTTWDTNIELGIAWGLAAHRQGRGAATASRRTRRRSCSSPTARHGAARWRVRWRSRRPAPCRSMRLASARAGADSFPSRRPTRLRVRLPEPVYSILDRPRFRPSQRPAAASTSSSIVDGDREIANEVIEGTRRRAGFQSVEEGTEPLYWRCLVVAAGFLGLAGLFLHERSELWIHAAGAAAALLIVTRLTR